MNMLLRWGLVLLTMATAGYEQSIMDWRAQHQTKLRGEYGYLSVAGLFWLKPGVNTVGSAETNDIVLPKAAPAKAGSFIFKDGKVTWDGRAMEADNSKSYVELGKMRMYVIERGERTGIRLRDPDSSFRRDFTGSKWYPVNAAYKFEADFIPYPQPKKVEITSIIGHKDIMEAPGLVKFKVDGKEVTLQPVSEDDHLWFIFRDQTAGKETYGAGRFLYFPLPKDGKVIVDFNKAENPPCAFNPYTTCPLPPAQNKLSVAIPAGEKVYAAH